LNEGEGGEPWHPAPPEREDWILRSSPYLDFITGATSLDARFGEAFSPGIQAGLYVERLLKLTARGLVLLDDSTDYHVDDIEPGFSVEDVDGPTLMFGGTAALVLMGTSHFAMSAGLNYMRTDKSEPGHYLGIGLPFEWQTDRGIRIGFEASFGQAFGGHVKARCANTSECAEGETTREDLKRGPGFYAQFQIGVPLVRPELSRAEGESAL
jgi:hypothetical protein